MLKGKKENGGKLRTLVHNFYVDNSPYNITYQEGHNFIRRKYQLDISDPALIDTKILEKAINGKKMRLFRNEEIIKEYDFEGKNKKNRNPNHR